MTALQNAQSARGGSFTICAAAGTRLGFVDDPTASSSSDRVPMPGEGAVRRVPRHVPRVVGSMRRYTPRRSRWGWSTSGRRVTLAILIGCHSEALLLMAD